MNRSESRECAFNIIFESLFDETNDTLSHYNESIEFGNSEDSVFVRELLTKYENNKQEITSAIEKYSQNWKTNRISKVSSAILRLATTEMFYFNDVPLKVSLNEGINLSKKYDDESAFRFVNGILNSIMHDEHAIENDK